MTMENWGLLWCGMPAFNGTASSERTREKRQGTQSEYPFWHYFGVTVVSSFHANQYHIDTAGATEGGKAARLGHVRAAARSAAA